MAQLHLQGQQRAGAPAIVQPQTEARAPLGCRQRRHVTAEAQLLLNQIEIQSALAQAPGAASLKLQLAGIQQPQLEPQARWCLAGNPLGEDPQRPLRVMPQLQLKAAQADG